MKNLVTNLLILVAVSVAWFLFGRLNGYNSASVEYEQKITDILAVCNEVPDTVRTTDTIWDTKIIYKEKYVPAPVSPGEYRDTVKTEDLDFWVHDYTTGVILSRETGYRLKVPKVIRDTTTIYKPVPKLVEVEKTVYVQNKAYIRGSIGFNYYSLGYGKIFNNRHALGASIVLYDNSPTVALDYTYFINNKQQR